MPNVSVIIPNYNHAQFLHQRITSVLNQTYQDFEVIILDDHSTDNSKEVIESYRGNKKISHIVYNNENSSSTFKQWYKGASLATSNYLWIAESDDYADETFLETLFGKITSNPQAAVIFCSSYIVDNNEKELDFKFWGEDLNATRWKSDYINDGVDEITNYLLYKNIIINASAVVFKKEVFLDIAPQTYTGFKFAGDWLIWVNLLHTGSIIYLSQKLNYFRFHVSSTRSVKSIPEEIRRIKEYFKVISFIEDKYHPKTNIKKHLWIIEEWYRKRKMLRKRPLLFLFPPFGYRHMGLFYFLLLSKQWAKLKRPFII